MRGALDRCIALSIIALVCIMILSGTGNFLMMITADAYANNYFEKWLPSMAENALAVPAGCEPTYPQPAIALEKREE